MAPTVDTQTRDNIAGLEIIWEGHTSSRITADLVAVHGLAAGAISTYENPPGPNLLSHLLPRDADIPNIRILAFGYAAADAFYKPRAGEPTSTSRTKTIAEELCFELQDLRDLLPAEEINRPIIFLGHGIGGIIIKRALVDNKFIQNLTRHVLFFDTPHNGFDLNAWKDICGREFKPEAELQFQIESAMLSELNREFTGVAKATGHLRCSAFYASSPVVTQKGEIWSIREGSTLLNNGDENPCQLTRVSHMTMLQFSGPLDPMYKRVKARLRSILTRINNHDLDNQLVFWSERNGSVQRNPRYISDGVLKWLSTYDHVSNQDRLRSMRLPDTNDWILKAREFIDWLNREEPSCLWCSGNIGAGKTILCSRIIEELQTRFSNSTNVAIIYIYCQYNEPVTLTMPTIIGSLVKQLLLQLEANKVVHDKVLQDRLGRMQRQGRLVLDGRDGIDILQGLVGKFSRVFLFLDGLDECNTSPTSEGVINNVAVAFLRFAALLLATISPTKLKIFLSSRPEIDVHKIIPSCIHLPLSVEKIQKDIATLVREEVEDKIWIAGLTEDYALVEDIKNELIVGAQGMILWAKLQIQALCEDCNSDSEFRDALENLPSSINEHYDRCLNRIFRRKGNQSCALQVLKWVSCSYRAMHVEELKEAINIKFEDSRWTEAKSRMANVLLVNSCGGLVYMDDIDGIVRLVHPSVKAYLCLIKESSTFQPFNINKTSTDLYLGEMCLVYLSFLDFSTQIELMEETKISREILFPNPLGVIALNPGAKLISNLLIRKRDLSPGKVKTQTIQWRPVHHDTFAIYQFLNYAREYWALHTKRISPTSPLFSAFKQFALHPNKSWKFQPWFRDEATCSYSEAYFEWSLNSEHIPLLSLVPEIDKRTSLCDLPHRILSNRKMAIHHAAAEGLETVIAAFISWNQKCIIAKDGFGCTSLHYAARFDRAVTSKLLVDGCHKLEIWNKADSNPCQHFLSMLSKQGYTALYEAVINNSVEAVGILLSEGACIDIKTKSQHPILFAAEHNYHQILYQLLFQHREPIATEMVVKALQIAAMNCQEQSAAIIQIWAATYHYDLDPDDKIIMQTLNSHSLGMLNLLLSSRNEDQLSRIFKKRVILELIASDKIPVLDILLNRAEEIFGNEVYEEILNHVLYDLAASTSGTSKGVRAICQHGANINWVNFKNESILWAAVLASNLEILTVLLELGAKIYFDSKKMTPAGFAVSTGNDSMLRILVQYGANVNEESYFESKEPFSDRYKNTTLLIRAIVVKDFTILHTLLELGANKFLKSKNGMTPLLCAIESGNSTAMSIFLKDDTTAQKEALELVHSSSDLKLKHNMGYSKLMPLLLQYGVDASDTIGCPEKSLLICAITLGREDWVNFLLKNGASTKWIDSNRETALFHVVRSNVPLSTLELLISHKIPLNYRNLEGKTALDYVISEETRQLLIKAGARKSSSIEESERISKELAQPIGVLDLYEDTGLAAIKKCDLFDEFIPLTGDCAEMMKIADQDGNIVLTKSFDVESRPEISRHDLNQLLISRIPAEAVKWEHKLLSVTNSNNFGRNEVELDFGVHNKQMFDLVIGADGAWSRVRNLLTAVKPQYVERQIITLTIQKFGTKYPHLAELNVYFITSPDEDFAITSGLHKETAMGTKNKLLSNNTFLGQWGARMKGLVTVACDEESVDRPGMNVDIRAVYELPVGHVWEHNPGITLMGDAAHLMLPNGEGVNLRMWDAMMLSQAIIKAYETARQDAASFQDMLSPLMKDFETEMVSRAEKAAEEGAKAKLAMYVENGAAKVAALFKA